jgi:hypothetical protein
MCLRSRRASDQGTTPKAAWPTHVLAGPAAWVAPILVRHAAVMLLAEVGETDRVCNAFQRGQRVEVHVREGIRREPSGLCSPWPAGRAPMWSVAFAPGSIRASLAAISTTSVVHSGRYGTTSTFCENSSSENGTTGVSQRHAHRHVRVSLPRLLVNPRLVCRWRWTLSSKHRCHCAAWSAAVIRRRTTRVSIS